MTFFIFGRCPCCLTGMALDTSKPYREMGVICVVCGARMPLYRALGFTEHPGDPATRRGP